MDKNIKIYEINNKFFFTVNKFSSVKHGDLTRYSSNYYRHAWRAYNDAKNIALNHSYHISALEKTAIEDLHKPIIEEVSAETQWADHYEEIYDGLVDIADGVDTEDNLQLKVRYLEAKAVVEEILFIIEKMPESDVATDQDTSDSTKRLNKIISKIRSLVKQVYGEQLKADIKENEEKEKEAPEMGMENVPPTDPMGGMGEPPPMEGMPPMGGGMMASNRSFLKTANCSLEHDTELEMMDEYATRICQTLEEEHPKSVCKISGDKIILIESGEEILHVTVGDDMFIHDIVPKNKLEEVYPYQSLEFYQTYWKPIVEAIGHCCLGEGDQILFLDNMSLPDMKKECPCSFSGFRAIDKKTKEVVTMDVSFKGENPSWFVEPASFDKCASSRYTKEDYYKDGKGAIVVCTDPTLAGYYQRTGSVIQLVPFEDNLEVFVDFGGNVMRMIESQFEILPI